MTIVNSSGLNTSSSIFSPLRAKHVAQTDHARITAPASTPSPLQSRADPYAALTTFLNKLKDAQQAIKQTSAATQGVNQSRKAIAAETVRRLKEQLRMMMSMMAGMDPKTKARLIAKMAQELAAAVREYAAASGGDSQGGIAATADSADAQNGDTASSGDKQNDVADTSVSTSTQTLVTSTTENTTSSPNKIGELVRDQLAEYSQNSGSSDAKADQEFVMEVRKLAAMLKALAKQNVVQARNHPEKSTERETAISNDALREVERSLTDIASANTAVTVSISVVAK